MAESSELCSASPGAGVMDMFGASCILCGPWGREAAREGLWLLPRPELSQPRLSSLWPGDRRGPGPVRLPLQVPGIACSCPLMSPLAVGSAQPAFPPGREHCHASPNALFPEDPSKPIPARTHLLLPRPPAFFTL